MTYQVAQLWTYPVVGGPGVQYRILKTTGVGFSLDRQWALVAENGVSGELQFVEPYKKLRDLKIERNIDGRFPFVVSAPEVDRPLFLGSYAMRHHLAGTQPLVVQGEIEVTPTSDEINGWFSSYLGFPCQLVERPLYGSLPNENGDLRLAHPDHLSFGDNGHYLLITESSLEFVNTPDYVGTTRPISPNIVLDADQEPGYEGLFDLVHIGDFVGKNSGPCFPYEIDGVDDDEPVEFPLGIVLRTVGSKLTTIKVGDPVEIDFLTPDGLVREDLGRRPV